MNRLPRVRLRRKSRWTTFRRWALPVVGGVLLLWLGLAIILGGLAYTDGFCVSCHEMEPYGKAHAESGHVNIMCLQCHGQAGNLGAVAEGFAMQRRIVSSVFDVQPSPVNVDDKPCISCHSGVKKGVLVARGTAVRHEDFIEASCLECHGGTGHEIPGRTYTIPEMESCMNCHKTAATELSNCEICHPPGEEVVRRLVDTSWRTTHGANWKTTHGMGELKTCENCHLRGFCGKCHGVAVPHPADWAVIHGDGLKDVKSGGCITCHKQTWCTDCHGIEMPHPKTFLPVHGETADEVGEDSCYKCHNADACQACHFRSSHPQVPGVGFGHSAGEPSSATTMSPVTPSAPGLFPGVR